MTKLFQIRTNIFEIPTKSFEASKNIYIIFRLIFMRFISVNFEILNKMFDISNGPKSLSVRPESFWFRPKSLRYLLTYLRFPPRIFNSKTREWGGIFLKIVFKKDHVMPYCHEKSQESALLGTFSSHILPLEITRKGPSSGKP